MYIIGPQAESKEQQPDVPAAEITAHVETHGSLGASEPSSSDPAVSSESMEVVDTVELPEKNPEAISDCQGVTESRIVLQEGV